MSRRALSGLLALLLAVSLSACTPVAREPLKVVERDSGSLLELRVGDRFDVVLDANPSTGYVWAMSDPHITVVQPQGEPQFVLNSKAGDGSGKITWVFEAIAPGEDMLEMAYRRPGETDVAPLRTFVLFLTVK
jgi:inhibitor of cysteine peptidase